MTLTERQARNTESKAVSIAKEMPQQLAIGLAIHQSTRSKEVQNLLVSVFPKLIATCLNILLFYLSKNNLKYFCSTLGYQFFTWFWVVRRV
jgi:mannose/fructose/N-acetylgalactosamine-specific phosphotransferase system component IID